MDRRYYGLKAVLIGVALSAAILGGGLECSRLATVHNSNYQAAFVAQAAIYDAGIRIRHSLGHFFARTLADL
jgi:hypothetical protein